MAVRNAFLTCIICGATLLFLSGGSARAASCKEPETGTKDVPIFSPPRLQFYSAPDFRCAMNGVFVIPRDELVSYAETSDEWTSVMYVNPRTGKDVSGWVRSERLKQTGTMGPKQ